MPQANNTFGNTAPTKGLRLACYCLLLLLLTAPTLWAQRTNVIDNKGTLKSTGNLVTTAATAPTAPMVDDIWYDTTLTGDERTKVWDGTAWKEISPDYIELWVNNTNGGSYATNDLVAYNGHIYRNISGTNLDTTPDSDTTNWKNIDTYLGYKTTRHTTTAALAVTDAAHNLTDLHIEGTGDLTMDSTNLSDGTSLYITNTTANDRSLSFTNFMGAYLRNGGTETNLITTGLTLKPNTRYLVHITDNAGSFYFNATEAGGGEAGSITDEDGDTQIQVDEGANDDDTIRFDTDGAERMTINNTGLVAFGIDAGGTRDQNAAATYTTIGSTSGATLTVNNIILGTHNLNISLAVRTYTLPFTSTVTKGIVEATGAADLAGTNIKSSYWLYIADGTTANDTFIKAVRADFQLSGTDLQVRYADARYHRGTSLHQAHLVANYFETVSNWTTPGSCQIATVNITSTPTTAATNASIDTTTGNAYFRGSLSDSNNEAGSNGQILSTTAIGTDWVDKQYLGYKTTRHTTSSTLAVTDADHNLTDLHLESDGDLTMDSTNLSDGTSLYITNTTAADRSLSFTNFMGAYLRNGGTETNLITTGLTLKPNTRYLVHITDNAGSFYFNATEAGGGEAGSITDEDGDTQIQVDEGGNDDDTIRFDTAGTERMTVDNLGNVNVLSTTSTAFVDATGSGTASASSVNAANTAANAFDNSDTTGWGNDGATDTLPAWLQYDFGNGQSQTITSYSLYRNSNQPGTYGAGTTYTPSAWTFQGSVDASAWVTLDTQTAQAIVADAAKTSYSFTNTTAYRYYRLTITAGGTGGDWVNISEMELLESVNTAPSMLHAQGNFRLDGTFRDANDQVGAAGQILSSTTSGTNWIDFDSGTLVDADSDTQIQVDEGADDDTIRFDTAGTERMTVDNLGNVNVLSTTSTAFVDATGSGTASASSVNAANTAANAFDNSDTTGWGNDGATDTLPAWLQYDFGNGQSQTITSYSLYRNSNQPGTYGAGTTYTPSAWTFQGSVDASAWVTLDTQTAQAIVADAAKTSYSFTNTTAYRYYRLTITAGGTGGDWVNISEMELLESVNTAPSMLHAQGNFRLDGTFRDANDQVGAAGQILSSTTSGTNWIDFDSGTLVDADSDTQIQVDEGADDDTIRFDTAGTERMTINNTGLVAFTGGTTTRDQNAAATYTTIGSTSGATLTVNNIILGTHNLNISLAVRTYTLPFTSTVTKGIVEATGAADLAGTNIKSSYWLYIADGTTANDTFIKAVRADFQLSGTDLQVRYADARYHRGTSLHPAHLVANYFETLSNWTTPGGYQIATVNITSTATTKASIDTATGNAYFNGTLSDSSNDAGNNGQILTATATGTDWMTFPPRLSVSARDAITTWTAGDIIYNTDINKHQGYDGTIWNSMY